MSKPIPPHSSPPSDLLLPPNIKPPPMDPFAPSIPLAQRFWNINIPSTQHTTHCPEFLLGQKPKNIAILATPESDFQLLTWTKCKQLIQSGDIYKFQRTPLDLRAYLEYIYHLKAQYGSVLEFIQHERLHWPTLTPSGNPRFTDQSEYKILFNDWPYGIDPDVTHLVVWVKFELPEVENEGRAELRGDAKRDVEEFVDRTFCTEGGVEDGVARDRVRWFKNWKSLKSVHAIEHFHVMLYQASKAFLERVTNGDRAVSDILRDKSGNGEVMLNGRPELKDDQR